MKFHTIEDILQRLIGSYPQIDIICLGIAGFYDCRHLQSSWFSPSDNSDIVRDLSAARSDAKWTRKKRLNKPLFNGDSRTRTCDPLHVKQMLSQLSYISMRRL